MTMTLDNTELAKMLVICELAGKNPSPQTVEQTYEQKVKDVMQYRDWQIKMSNQSGSH